MVSLWSGRAVRSSRRSCIRECRKYRDNAIIPTIQMTSKILDRTEGLLCTADIAKSFIQPAVLAADVPVPAAEDVLPVPVKEEEETRPSRERNLWELSGKDGRKGTRKST